MDTPNPVPLPTTPVRRSVSALSSEFDHLSVNYQVLRNLSKELADDKFPLPEWRAPVFIDETTDGVTAEDVIDFFFLGNAINFQFRDYETGKKFTATYAGTEWAGAFAMWACLKREFEENPAILRGDTLANLRFDAVKRIFEPADGTDVPMLDERHMIFQEVGRQLEAQYEGHFRHLVRATEPRLYANGEGLVDTLTAEFRSFRDVSTVELSNGQSLDVTISKRAQLAPGMLYGRFQNSSEFTIEDPLAFTVFVDYNLPNILRGLNVIEYSESLAHAVDTRELIGAGSREEVEIRAATIHATDILINRINAERTTPIYGPHLDYKLFTMRDSISSPVHLTRTIAY